MRLINGASERKEDSGLKMLIKPFLKWQLACHYYQKDSGLHRPPPPKTNCTQFLILTAAKCCLLVRGFSFEFLSLSVVPI